MDCSICAVPRQPLPVAEQFTQNTEGVQNVEQKEAELLTKERQGQIHLFATDQFGVSAALSTYITNA